MSTVEIIATLCNNVIELNKENFKDKDRDRLILSKGHACMVYYTVVNLKGIMPEEQLKNFEKNNSDLPGHPVKNPELGIEFSKGSLGMGLSLGAGLAITLKKLIKKYMY